MNWRMWWLGLMLVVGMGCGKGDTHKTQAPGGPATRLASDGEVQLRVGCAEHLSELADALLKGYRKANPGTQVELELSGPGELLKSLHRGTSDVDVVLSSVEPDMRELQNKGNLIPGSLVVIAHNTIGLLARLDRKMGPVDLQTLAQDPRFKTIAMGDPTYVPASILARQGLEALGVWDGLVESGKLQWTTNAGAALDGLNKNTVDGAFGYVTEAMPARGMEVLATVSGAGVPTTPYLIASPTTAPHPDEAEKFREFALGEEGQAVLAGMNFLGK